ncbi:Late embryogenesis abundant protein [Quillaja saponaria]|uniref:Late embryogenesis abundant protein n=1 Tax=Quillaja saponaria TaxID=32244 RepID=A0AAD7PFH9_QUISA|nr:Late embryogenesis abundant protein [Quillaja saponaria]
MIHATKTVRSYPSKLFTTYNLPSNFGWRVSEVRFQQLKTFSNQPDHRADEMEKQEQNPDDHKNGDVMYHSFGEGYATRSDEEGFGGIYGGNQFISNKDKDELDRIHENHPAYDKTQGSEVKEKEKGRHQTKVE